MNRQHSLFSPETNKGLILFILVGFVASVHVCSRNYATKMPTDDEKANDATQRLPNVTIEDCEAQANVSTASKLFRDRFDSADGMLETPVRPTSVGRKGSVNFALSSDSSNNLSESLSVTKASHARRRSYSHATDDQAADDGYHNRHSMKRRTSHAMTGLSVIAVDESQDNTAKAILHEEEQKHVSFDPSAAKSRLDKMWDTNAEFGQERNPFNVYLEEIVTDRYCLVGGLQILRDELQLTFSKTDFCSPSDLKYKTVDNCCADVTIPSVVCTVAHTNCGDRICQASTSLYQQVVASRFASISELGEVKPELFNPTGGGTDDGATLAHVTVRHMFHDDLRNFIYDGNRQSFSLVNFDIKTHCGKLIVGPQETIVERLTPMTGMRLFFGSARESIWRDARSACGALYGCLNVYNENNAVHRRLRADLGEENYAYLSSQQVLADDQSTIVTYLVAASIVAIRGVINTAKALATTELDERGVGSLTASVTINSAVVGEPDWILYLARCTVFQGVITVQGLGTDARKYSASISDADLITLHYEGREMDEYEVVERNVNNIELW